MLVPLRLSSFNDLKQKFDNDSQMNIGKHRHNTYFHYAYTPSQSTQEGTPYANVAILLQNPTAPVATLANLIFRYADYVCIVDLEGIKMEETYTVGVGDNGELVDTSSSVAFGATFANGIPLLIATNTPQKCHRYLSHVNAKFEGLKVYTFPPVSGPSELVSSIYELLPSDEYFTRSNIPAPSNLRWTRLENGGVKILPLTRDTGDSTGVPSASAAAESPISVQTQKSTATDLSLLSPYVANYDIRCALPTRLSYVCGFTNIGIHLCYIQQGTISVGEVINTADPASYVKGVELLTIVEMRTFPTTTKIPKGYAGQFVCLQLSGGKSIPAMTLLTWGSALGSRTAYNGDVANHGHFPRLQQTWLAKLNPIKAHQMLDIRAHNGSVIAKDGVAPQSSLLKATTRGISADTKPRYHCIVEMGTGTETNGAPLDTHLHCLPSIPNLKQQVMFLANKSTMGVYSLHAISQRLPRAMGFVVAANELRANGSSVAAPAPIPLVPQSGSNVSTPLLEHLITAFTKPFGEHDELDSPAKERLFSSLVAGILAVAPTEWAKVNGFVNHKSLLPDETTAIAMLTCLKDNSADDPLCSSQALKTAVKLVVENSHAWAGQKHSLVNFFSQKIEDCKDPGKQREEAVMSSLLKASVCSKFSLQRLADALQINEKGKKYASFLEQESIYSLIAKQSPGAALAINSQKGGWTWEFMLRFLTVIPNIKPYLLLYAALKPADGMKWWSTKTTALPVHTIAILDRWALASSLPPLEVNKGVDPANNPITPYAYALMYLFSRACNAKGHAIPSSVMLKIAMYVSIG